MRVLVLNCGSSSLKWKLIDTASRRAGKTGKAERIGQGGRTHAQAVREVLNELEGQTIEAVGHRVVHGGERFHQPALVTDEVLQAIEACVPLAPLHNPANLTGIRAAQEALPGVPHVAVFDTAFHQGLPRRARTYALDVELCARLGVRRYGFHGLSHAFVAEEAARHLHRPLSQLRLISLHLGNGASACAIEYGRSTETSMGMTPLEGLVMGTRAGDVDPGVVLHLLRQPGASLDSVDDLLTRQGGLAGLSGHGNDLRDLEERAARGDDRARLAIAVFAHRARKYVGAYAVTMAGLDAVVLTGGIGENSVAMRRRILQRLELLGLILDRERNAAARVGAEQRVVEISAPRSRVRALVVATDEELLIAEETALVAAGRTAVARSDSIPVAARGACARLDALTLAALFGPEAALTPVEPLCSTGLFRAAQTVDLVGPRARIEGVPVVGPLVGQSYVEVNARDEFVLGVDAPVRAPRQLEGSAPIVLAGPAGSVELREGLIQSRRLLRISPQDAQARGLEAGDEVAVTLRTPRDEVVLRDVLVFLAPGAETELHLAQDEPHLRELALPDDVGPRVRVPEASAEPISRRPTSRLPR